MILAVAMSVPRGSEDDLAAWYTEEHIPMLLAVPGWRRIRRFRLTRALDGPGPGFLSVHELAGRGPGGPGLPGGRQHAVA